jgi:hypothetical protein
MILSISWERGGEVDVRHSKKWMRRGSRQVVVRGEEGPLTLGIRVMLPSQRRSSPYKLKRICTQAAEPRKRPPAQSAKSVSILAVRLSLPSPCPLLPPSFALTRRQADLLASQIIPTNARTMSLTSLAPPEPNSSARRQRGTSRLSSCQTSSRLGSFVVDSLCFLVVSMTLTFLFWCICVYV